MNFLNKKRTNNKKNPAEFSSNTCDLFNFPPPSDHENLDWLFEVYLVRVGTKFFRPRFGEP